MTGSDESKVPHSQSSIPRTALALGAALCLAACGPAGSTVPRTEWQDNFNLLGRTLSDSGESRYFILRPGFQLVLASGSTRLTITVLDETKRINGVVTRVVEEREEKNGQPAEVARNFFAIDRKTGDVFYFGEEVDDYKGGRIAGHSGSWVADARSNRPGLIMPGAPKVGMKYFQELAPGVAMDRAEVTSTSARCSAPAGKFEKCLITRETTTLVPSVVEQKIYAPNIGLVQDQSLQLVSYGYVKKTG